MKRRLPSTIRDKLPAALTLLGLVAVWQLVCSLGLMPAFMLPSPVKVVRAFADQFGILMAHSVVTLQEAFYGLAIGVALGFVFAVLMDTVGMVWVMIKRG